MGLMPGRRHRGVWGLRGIDGNLPFVVRGGDSAMAHTAAGQAGKWYRGIVKAENGFMARWHRAEVEKSLLRHENVGAKQEDEKERGRGGVVLISLKLIKAEKY